MDGNGLHEVLWFQTARTLPLDAPTLILQFILTFILAFDLQEMHDMNTDMFTDIYTDIYIEIHTGLFYDMQRKT
jgi:hypothetical protein